MPIYEYQCQKCDTILEVWGNITDDALVETKCPKCKVIRTVSRIMSGNSFILNGSGWTPINNMPFDAPKPKNANVTFSKKYKF